MKLTNIQIVQLLGNPGMGAPGALKLLHGYNAPVKDKGKVITDKEGNPVMDQVFYDFAPGVRMAVAIITQKLQPYNKGFAEERNAIIAKYKKLAKESGEAKIAKMEDSSELTEEQTKKINDLNIDNAVYVEFEKELDSLLETEVEVEAYPLISEKDLNVDDNKLAPDLLAAIMPIVKSKNQTKE